MKVKTCEEYVLAELEETRLRNTELEMENMDLRIENSKLGDRVDKLEGDLYRNMRQVAELREELRLAKGE